MISKNDALAPVENASPKMTIRKGVVRVWNVYAQTWMRIDARKLIERSAIMASLSAKERARIRRAARL